MITPWNLLIWFSPDCGALSAMTSCSKSCQSSSRAISSSLGLCKLLKDPTVLSFDFAKSTSLQETGYQLKSPLTEGDSHLSSSSSRTLPHHFASGHSRAKFEICSYGNEASSSICLVCFLFSDRSGFSALIIGWILRSAEPFWR